MDDLNKRTEPRYPPGHKGRLVSSSKGMREWSTVVKSSPSNNDSDSDLEDYSVTSTDYDVMLLYAEGDRKEAFEYLHHLRNDIRLEDGRAIKAGAKLIHDIPSLDDLLIHHGAVFKRCSYIFFYVTENLIEDCLFVYLSTIHYERLMDRIVAVYTKDKESFDLPFELRCCQGLDYFRNNALYRRSVVSLFERPTQTHLLQDKRLVEDRKLETKTHVREDDGDDYFSYMHNRLSTRYFDLMVLCAQPDKLAAIRYLRYLRNNIRLKHGEKVKAVLYDNPSSLGALDRHNLDEAFMRCPNVFLYFTSSFRKYIWSKIPRDSMLMQTILDKKQSGRVVLVCYQISEPIPDELLHLQRLDYYNMLNLNIVTSLFEKSAREMDTLQGERKTNVNIYDQSQIDLSEQLNLLKMKTTQESVDDLCAYLTALSPDIIHVWEGFKQYESEEQKHKLGRIFVAVVKRKLDNLKEKIKTCLSISETKSLRVIQRLPNEVSDEAKKCLEKEANIAFSLEEHNKIRDTLLRNSGDLMKTHSNLQIVSASRLRSKHEGESFIIGPCIVLYVHVKGMIPVKEEPFPPTVGDFPVDVREGVFTNFADPRLAIGSTIKGKKDTSGKIAGFVQLPNGNIGSLTCAHVFDIHENMEVDDTESTKEDVYQLSPSGSSDPFGKVYQRIYEPGFLKNESEYKIGIDAALIEITDKLRYPKDGNYKHSVSPSVECASTLDYYSGEILTSPAEVAKMHIVNKMKCKIVRYNEDKRKLYVRTGRINVDSTSVRLKLNAWWPPTPNEACQLYAQIHVQPDPDEILDVEDKSFATYGDSGSLVFLVSDDGEHMWAFGMVVGGIEADGSAIVTPISAVLDAFGLPPKFMSFIYIGKQFNELSAKVDKMDAKMDEMDEKIDKILTYITGKDSHTNTDQHQHNSGHNHAASANT